eukprot:30828-Eustigmatos_ZCMA.PRE.1
MKTPSILDQTRPTPAKTTHKEAVVRAAAGLALCVRPHTRLIDASIDLVQYRRVTKVACLL